MEGSLLGVLGETLTPMGSRLLRRWINQPLLDVAAINRRLDAVQGFVDNTLLRLDVRGMLRNFGDLELDQPHHAEDGAAATTWWGFGEALRLLPELERD